MKIFTAFFLVVFMLFTGTNALAFLSHCQFTDDYGGSGVAYTNARCGYADTNKQCLPDLHPYLLNCQNISYVCGYTSNGASQTGVWKKNEFKQPDASKGNIGYKWICDSP